MKFVLRLSSLALSLLLTCSTTHGASIAELKRATEEDGKQKGAAWAKLGSSQMAAGLFSDALRSFSKGLRVEPGSPELLRGMDELRSLMAQGKQQSHGKAPGPQDGARAEEKGTPTQMGARDAARAAKTAGEEEEGEEASAQPPSKGGPRRRKPPPGVLPGAPPEAPGPRWPESVEVGADGSTVGSASDGGAGSESVGDGGGREVADALPLVWVDYQADFLNDEVNSFTKQGIAAAGKGNFSAALNYFWAESYRKPFESGIWDNIANACMDLGNQLLNKQQQQGGDKKDSARGGLVHAVACEGVAAKAVSRLMRGKDDPSVDATLASLLATFGGEDSCDEGRQQKRRVNAAKALALAATNAVGAAKMLCRSPEALRVPLTPSLKRRGVVTATFMLAFLSRMRVCGVVAVPNMFDPAFIDALEAAHRANHDPSLLKGSNVETDTVASRGTGRFEIKFRDLKAPFTDPRLTVNAQLLMLVKGAVGGDHIEIDTFSHVDSLPGSVMQVWHEDVDPVMKFTQVGEALHAPPQGVVVVVPMVDVDALNGPTEFSTGSHVNTPSTKGTATPSFIIPAKKGDAVIFDLRIRHRGTPNKSDKIRPIIYMSYVHAWFRDDVNFKGRQTKDWDKEFTTTAARKLFMRADQQRYIDRLEELVEASGVSVKDLQTSLAYRAVEMKV